MISTGFPDKKTKRVENVRARLQSLRVFQKVDQDSLTYLQKSLQKHNTIDDPETRPQQLRIGDEDDSKTEDKLWNYFKLKSEQFNNKIEKQRVNGWQKIIKSILLETEKKEKINEQHTEQMQQMIKNKYKQIHLLFKQIEAIRMDKLSQKQKQRASRRRRSDVQTSRGEKINVIRQNILSLKQQIQERGQQNEKIISELNKFKKQKKSLIINLMKYGYYLNDGIKLFLQRLAEMNQKPNPKDFPEFLDVRSRQFLIKQYQDLKNQHHQQKMLSQRSFGQSERIRTKSNTELGILAKHQRFKDIYNGTKDYLLKLLVQQSWRKESIKLPKIAINNAHLFTEKRRQIQRKRIKSAYPQQLREIVRKIQFGLKLQTTQK